MIGFALTLCFLLFGADGWSMGLKADPECYMTPTQIANKYGYELERHWVTTPDGYILEIHRIPAETKPVVFLQHGLMDSSITWMLDQKEGSFAFLLADAGFDVWMGNVRGNTYTKNHTSIPVNSDRFWDFTFDEMAAIDLPTMIDYTLYISGQEDLFYFGHSQGSEMAFCEFSRNQALAKNIKLFTAFAPVARANYITGLFKVMSTFHTSLEWIFKELGVRQFMPSGWFFTTFATMVCPLLERHLCTNMIFLMAGYDRSNFNSSRVEIYEAHVPAGTSVKNIIHWAQIISAKQLQAYDYESPTLNYLHYGDVLPPVYNISGLTVPTVLVMGGNDWLGDARDLLWLEGQIGHVIVKQIFMDYYNHLDFLWGIDSPEKVYHPMIEYIKNML